MSLFTYDEACTRMWLPVFHRQALKMAFSLRGCQRFQLQASYLPYDVVLQELRPGEVDFGGWVDRTGCFRLSGTATQSANVDCGGACASTGTHGKILRSDSSDGCLNNLRGEQGVS
eukprot:2509335-Pleurochrysis_carterae.AAC.3